MQSPGNEVELVTGLLSGEGLISREHAPKIEIIHKVENRVSHVNVLLPGLDMTNVVNKRSLLSAAACGICGTRELEFVEGDLIDDKSQSLSSSVLKMFGEMSRGQASFHESGGSHAAALFTLDGRMLTIKEDVGRHNAVDKVVGDLIIQGKINEAHLLVVSGRISYEIVAKCFKARIPVLAAVSAPSSLAVDFAKELGITVLAFCRKNRFTIYSHPERIKDI